MIYFHQKCQMPGFSGALKSGRDFRRFVESTLSLVRLETELAYSDIVMSASKYNWQTVTWWPGGLLVVFFIC
jgi:hypothetical protein